MTDKTDQIQKNSNQVIYIGSDLGYWQNLSNKISIDYKQIDLSFTSLTRENGTDIQSLIIEIRQIRPKLIYVDFSTHTSEMLHLVRILSRLNGVLKPFIVGLVEYNQGLIPIERAALAGLTCCHIKSAELDAVVFDSICFAYSEVLEDHGFATAKLNDDITAFIPCMVSTVSNEGMRVESNIPMTIGSSYFIHTFWYKKGILKSPEVQCASSSSEDLYYNFNYAKEFAFDYVSVPEHFDDMEPEQIEQNNKEHEYQVKECKIKLGEWTLNNQSKSAPKMLKTLIIDKELNFYQNQPLSDDYPFVIRCQPYLINVKEELLKAKPQMIVFHMEEISNEELEANEDIAHTFNESRTLQYLIKIINSINNYSPFIVVFNSVGHDTEKLQTVLKYKHIIANKEKLTPDLVLKMAKLLESRLSAQREDDDSVIYLKKDHPASYAEIEVHISLVACSENDIYFNSELDLEIGTVLRVNLPAPMFLTVAPPPGKGGANSKYYSIIHGIGEVEKKELRRFINGVFFRAHESKKTAEKDEFEKLNKQVEQKRLEAEQKKLALEKAAKEAEKEAEEAKKIEAEKQKQRNDVLTDDE